MTWLMNLLEKMSPEIVAALREGLTDLLQKCYEKALRTENRWDDRAIETMAAVAKVELFEPQTESSE